MTQASAADRKSIRAQEKLAKAAETLRADVLRSIMSNSLGRQWIWDQLTLCHIFEANTISDPRLSAMFDGERNAGLRLLNDVMAFTPDQFVQAMREANERRDRDNRPAGTRPSAPSEHTRSPDPGGGDQGRADLDGGDLDYDPYARSAEVT